MRWLAPALLLLAGAACGSRRDVTAVLVLEGAPAAGEAQYQMHCARCHGAEGGGVAGAPALATRARDVPDPVLVDVMLNGRGGMPATRLTDQQAADVLAWLRARWP